MVQWFLFSKQLCVFYNLLESPFFPKSDILKHAYIELEYLRRTLKRLDSISPTKSRKKVNALDGRIKDAVWRFEDSLESHLSHQILSHHFKRESDRVLLFSIDLLRNDAGSFIETVKDMKNEYLYELDSMPQVEEDEESAVNVSSSKMVGFYDVFMYVKIYLMQESVESKLYSLVGMPGSGKTTLAEKVFQDPEVSRWFDRRVWVTVGRKYELNEIKRHILAQLDPHNIDQIPQGDDKISEILKGKMESKRCLIVLDNIWDTDVIDYFSTLMPEDAAVIRILLTTNLDKVSERNQAQGDYDRCIMGPLNEKESEDLLRMEVFGEEVKHFPPLLEKAAKKIAKNCKGLPLMIVTVADLLSKANKNYDPEFWNEVAQNRNSDVMMEAHDQIAKVLFPVYDCFPQSSKMLYLYMAAFPQDSEIPASKLINMLTAEGFFKLQELPQICHIDQAFDYVFSTTVVVYQEKSVNLSAIKTYGINSSWCHLFNKESWKDKFLLLLNSGCVVALEQCMKGQRRLCLHANFVFNFKEVYSSVKCDCAPTARSLLCFGPYHPYSMPLDAGFKLLRVLDALKVRFYTFPDEILELVLLQYLALTYNGELPTSISKLFNLEFLIIHPHMTIKSCGAQSYMPVQIWDMQELKHIEILGNNLPNDPNSADSLQKLSTLLGVTVHSCTREVLERLPNIRKLGIQIELTHSGDDGLNFDHIGKLKKLETLKCSSIVNPDGKYGCVAPQIAFSLFPSSLRKLRLSGLGYPWKYMEAIGVIPNLEVLKLQCYAFQGPKWETKLNSFLRLKYLVIEDTDLVQWTPRRGSFPKLHKLYMKHCYKLQEFDWPYDARGGSIELVDCNPIAVTCAKQLKPTKEYYGLRVSASFDGKELN